MDEARVHYAYTDAGGTAPNIIPAKASFFMQSVLPEEKMPGCCEKE